MSKETADIIGPSGANFTFTLSAGTIVKAELSPGKKPLTVVGPNEVAVDNLPPGDSGAVLTLIWAPEDPDAEIGVGDDAGGTVKAADPKGIINAGDNPGLVKLFGVQP